MSRLVWQILHTPGRVIPLRRLFSLKQYPPDVMVLYAEGYSVTNFLVGQSNRSVFLAFLNLGMNRGWDAALQTYYRYRSVEELEGAWLQQIRETRGQPIQLASRNQPGQPVQNPYPGGQRVEVRQTVPPAQPLLESSQQQLESAQPIVRGQAPDSDEPQAPPQGQGWSAAPVAWDNRAQGVPTGGTSPFPQPQTNWQMQPQPGPAPAPVWLGSPRTEVAQPIQFGQPLPGEGR